MITKCLLQSVVFQQISRRLKNLMVLEIRRLISCAGSSFQFKTALAYLVSVVDFIMVPFRTLINFQRWCFKTHIGVLEFVFLFYTCFKWHLL